MEPPSDTADPLSFLIVLLNSLFGEPFSTYSSQLLIISILLLLSALISSIEVAFFSLTPEEYNKSKSSKQLQDKRIIFLLENPKALLASIIIFNNLVNVSVITLTTYFAWKNILGESYSILSLTGLVVTLAIILIFLGEIFPKIYANQYRWKFARKTSFFTLFLYKILKPVSWILLSFDSFIDKRINKKGYNLSLDELNEAVDITTEKDATQEEKEILKGIVNFSTTSVKQIMKSRLDIVAFDYELTFEELLKELILQGYSRIPVYKDTIDNIEGVLYIKDLLPYVGEEQEFEWQKLIRQGFFIPESKKIDDLLKDFQEKKVHMAIVVDEYGGTSGLVTLEDIIEEIVGEINDEFDDSDEIIYSQLDERTFIFEGKTLLEDFGKISDVDVNIFDEVKADNESLGGLLLELFSRLPSIGEQITYDKFEFTVIGVDQKRINRVKIYIKDKSDREGQLV